LQQQQQHWKAQQAVLKELFKFFTDILACKFVIFLRKIFAAI
jgi:hypothetical protein